MLKANLDMDQFQADLNSDIGDKVKNILPVLPNVAQSIFYNLSLKVKTVRLRKYHGTIVWGS